MLDTSSGFPTNTVDEPVFGSVEQQGDDQIDGKGAFIGGFEDIKAQSSGRQKYQNYVGEKLKIG